MDCSAELVIGLPSTKSRGLMQNWLLNVFQMQIIIISMVGYLSFAGKYDKAVIELEYAKVYVMMNI